ncbi:MAG TPA: hypothetical protein VID29_00860 [Solirubrobacteraceae bacterium]|jgi:hypothetical protein
MTRKLSRFRRKHVSGSPVEGLLKTDIAVDLPMDLEYTVDFELGRAQLLCRQSSASPQVYAFMLRIRHDGRWRTIMSIDNNHAPAGAPCHHLHRYADDGRKGPRAPLPFELRNPNNIKEAMDKAIDWLIVHWEESSR